MLLYMCSRYEQITNMLSGLRQPTRHSPERPSVSVGSLVQRRYNYKVVEDPIKRPNIPVTTENSPCRGKIRSSPRYGFAKLPPGYLTYIVKMNVGKLFMNPWRSTFP